MSRHSVRFAVLLVALTLCLLLFGSAQASSASTVELIPASRIVIMPLRGIAYSSQSIANGAIDLVIDDLATDWSQALTYGVNGDALNVGFSVTAPQNASRFVSISGNAWENDAEIIDALQQQAQFYTNPVGNQYANSYQVATYEPLRGVVSTNGRMGDGFIHAICWLDASGNILLIEKTSLSVTHTTNQYYAGAPALIHASDVIANADGASNVTYTAQDGVLTYHITGAPSPNSVQTDVVAPAGATEYQLYHNGVAMGQPMQVFNGRASLWHGADATGVRLNNVSIEWRDGNGAIGGGALSIYIVNDRECDPLPSYEPSFFTPVSSDDLQITLHDRSGVITTQYTNNVLHYGFAGASAASARDLCDAYVELAIAAPAGASYYVEARTSGNGFLGNNAYMLDDLKYNLENARHRDLENGGFYDCIDLFYPSAYCNDTTLYLPACETKFSFGTLYVIQWRDASDTILRTDWFGETSDSFAFTQTTASYASLGDLPPVVTDPVVVVEPSDAGLQLKSVYLPQQSADNALNVELHLLDEQSAIVQPNEPVTIVLPYPEGQSYPSPYTYTLKHYNEGLTGFSVVALTQTPNGLQFVTSSLSPLTLLWSGSSASGNAPQTDDAFPLALYCTLGALALAVAVLLIVRKKRK